MSNECVSKCADHVKFEIEINKKYDVLLDATSRHSKKTDILQESVIELRSALIGTVDKKGILHEMHDVVQEMRKHIDEYEKYKPMIEENNRVCTKLTKSFNYTAGVLVKKIVDSGVYFAIAVLSFDKIKGFFK